MEFSRVPEKVRLPRRRKSAEAGERLRQHRYSILKHSEKELFSFPVFLAFFSFASFPFSGCFGYCGESCYVSCYLVSQLKRPKRSQRCEKFLVALKVCGKLVRITFHQFPSDFFYAIRTHFTQMITQPLWITSFSVDMPLFVYLSIRFCIKKVRFFWVRNLVSSLEIPFDFMHLCTWKSVSLLYVAVNLFRWQAFSDIVLRVESSLMLLLSLERYWWILGIVWEFPRRRSRNMTVPLFHRSQFDVET